MINTLNKTIVNETFNHAYKEEQFKLFIKDLLVDSNFEKAHNIMLPNDYKDFIKSARRICKYKYTSEEYVDDKVIDETGSTAVSRSCRCNKTEMYYLSWPYDI